MDAVRTSFFEDDSDAVLERLRAQYGKVSLSDSHVTMAENLFTTPKFFIEELTFTGAYSGTAECTTLTALASTVSHRWRVGDETGDAQEQPFLIRPGTHQEMTCAADATLVTFAFDAAHLEQAAQRFYADDRLRVRFDSAAPVNATYGRYYRSLLSHAAASLPLLAESDLARASLYRLMAAGLLECFALHGEPADRVDSVLSQQNGYRRAQTFIDDHAAQPITVEDIAGAASLSARQLDDAFHSLSPSRTSAGEALRAARLAGAHNDLATGDPTRGDTVRDIALRWGFNPANFARRYRAAYGVAPLQTLNR